MLFSLFLSVSFSFFIVLKLFLQSHTVVIMRQFSRVHEFIYIFFSFHFPFVLSYLSVSRLRLLYAVICLSPFRLILNCFAFDVLVPIILKDFLFFHFQLSSIVNCDAIFEHLLVFGFISATRLSTK